MCVVLGVARQAAGMDGMPTDATVNKDGDDVGYYGPQVSPSSIVGDIETLIAQS